MCAPLIMRNLSMQGTVLLSVNNNRFMCASLIHGIFGSFRIGLGGKRAGVRLS